jgi:DNA-binding YbaB/EbfC family protein
MIPSDEPNARPEEGVMFPEGTPEVPSAPDLQSLPDIQSLLAQAASMQQQLVQTQQQLSDARVDGTSGGGAVTATVSGTGELVALVIDPSVCDPADAETLADLVIAAVRDASTNAAELAAEQMSELTGPFGDETSPTGQLGF